jgi:HD superfamily phosphohydrolase
MSSTLYPYIEDSEEKWKELLKEVKVTKDAVEKRDVWLTQTEVDIIDTPEFQHLRRRFQLGPAYFGYKDATHTRFSHSIGVLYWTQRIIDAINRNYDYYHVGLRLTPKQIYLACITALLHDFDYVCYSHVLADEGRLLVGQWKDKERTEKLLGSESNVKKAIVKNLVDVFGKSEGEKNADEIIEQIKSILTEEDVKKLGDLAFISDIVKNTICADLLDYLERDTWFTGTFGSYDRRLISYCTVQEYEGINRLVIRLFKRRREDVRWDIIHAILDCLRLRYKLAATVYFHHTKQKTSAMLIKMVSAAKEANVINEENLLMLDDFSLTNFILLQEESKLKDETRAKHLKIAKKIATRLENRELYKPLLEFSRDDCVKSSLTLKRIDELINWRRRYDFETTLEKLTGVEDGGVILYIPQELGKEKEPEVLLKEAQALVESKYGIETLEDLGRREEFKTTIGDDISNLKSKHKALFKVSLFVSKDVMAHFMCGRVKRICQEWLEGKPPAGIIRTLLEKRGIKIEVPEEHLAETYHEGYLQEIGTKPKRSDTCELRICLEYIENRLGESGQ